MGHLQTPAQGSAEFDLLGVENCGTNLSILIFISAIMVCGSIKTKQNKNKKNQDTKHIWQNHMESSQWEGAWRELLAFLLYSAPGKHHD